LGARASEPKRLGNAGHGWHDECFAEAMTDTEIVTETVTETVCAATPLKRAHLTVRDRDILNGILCDCVACYRDGPHEPECVVHDEPIGECDCGRSDQAKGPG
jgi:hypothetical protein